MAYTDLTCRGEDLPDVGFEAWCATTDSLDRCAGVYELFLGLKVSNTGVAVLLEPFLSQGGGVVDLSP